MSLQKAENICFCWFPKRLMILWGMQAFFTYFLAKQYHVWLNHLVEYFHYVAGCWLSYGRSQIWHLEKAAEEKSLLKYELMATFKP